MPLEERVTHPSEESRWYQRRKFWFSSGILADRRSGIDRRTSGERRNVEQTAALAAGSDDRRSGSTRRGEHERRAAERRLIERRPLA
jgi:hypothetical protein